MMGRLGSSKMVGDLGLNSPASGRVAHGWDSAAASRLGISLNFAAHVASGLASPLLAPSVYWFVPLTFGLAGRMLFSRRVAHASDWVPSTLLVVRSLRGILRFAPG
jgi:hypothetical protein